MSETSLAEQSPGAGKPVRGDLTQGPILRTLVMFSIPALIGNVLQTVGGSINAIWIGQLLGIKAVAATASANMIMFLLFGTVFGFGMATTIRVGHLFGARDIDGARRNFGGGIGFCVGLSLVITITVWLLADRVLALMATPAEVRGDAHAYLRIAFLSMPFSTFAMMVSMGLRGAGDATTPLFNSVITVVLATILNPLLIKGIGPIPPMGIAGSALAGFIAGMVGAVQMIWTIYARDLPLRLRGAELRYLLPSREEVAYMLAKGLPMGAQTLLSTAAGVIMIGLVNREGMIAAAAYGASLQLWNYVQMPAMAVGSAVSTMVAQNIGARQHHRVGRITMSGLWSTFAVTLALAAGLVLFDKPVLGLFLGAGSPAIPLAEHIQLICTWSFAVSSVMMVLFATMRAYGAVWMPLIVMFTSLYPVRIGFYALAQPTLHSEAVWWTFPVSSVVSVVLAVLAYRFGRWRKVQAAGISAQPASA